MKCKECDREITRKTAERCERHYRKLLREENPARTENNNLKSREWRANNLKRAREYDKSRSQKRKEDLEYKEKQKYRGIKKNYNLDREEYDEMVSRGCGICGSFNKPHVDHCHETGKVRGILCHKCNLGLGFLERPDNWANKAEIYLFMSKLTPEYIAKEYGNFKV